MEYTTQRRDSSDSLSSSKSSSHPLTSAAAPTSAVHPNRKARTLDAGSTNTNAERSNLPPSTGFPWRSSFPQAARRPSSSSITPSTMRGQDPRDNTGPQPSIDEVALTSASERTSPALSYLRRGSVTEAQSLMLPQDPDRVRASFSSSIMSLGTSIMNAGWGAAPSTTSSVAGSEAGDIGQTDVPPTASTTAMSPVSVLTSGQSGAIGSIPSHSLSSPAVAQTADMGLFSPPGISPSGTITPTGTSAPPAPLRAPLAQRPSRSRIPRSRVSSITGSGPGTASPSSERGAQSEADPCLGIIGICALDSKARSKPSRNILNRITSKGEFEVIIFGDKVILDEEPENWPVCDYLISFFSDGFPLQKAIEYVRLRRPFTVNDLPMQMVLWDRRLCLQVLDRFDVPTPKRVEVNRDGGPKVETPELAQHIFERTGIKLAGPADGTGGGTPPPKEVLMIDEDTISVDGQELKKPFVEKPVSGEDHNIHIYFSSDVGGGGRRLFRKVNNKSSEADDQLNVPRSITDVESSYIYESFLSSANYEDVKAYTVGPEFCHAETRKSPVVDGIVKRNAHGKEMRFVTKLTPVEAGMAARITEAFGQRVCGFDLLRVGDKSFVIDVNGWSFVKDNDDYYDKCSGILKEMFVNEKLRKEGRIPLLDGENGSESEPPSRHGHLSALKTMLKSPSMSRLAGNNNSARAASPTTSADTSPIASPPSMDRLTMKSKLPHASTEPPPTPATTEVPPGGASSPAGATVDDTDVKPVPPPASQAQWKLKGMVAVIRHADRTPKQKFKFTFHTKPFVDLLKGHREEVLLVGEAALSSVLDAVRTAMMEGIEDPEKLKILRTALVKKGSWPGTKVQIKPMFRKKTVAVDGADSESQQSPELSKGARDPLGEMSETDHSPDSPSHKDKQLEKRNNSVAGVTLSRAAAEEENLEFEKLQLIIKWGGEPTHSARYQSQELGENMRNDLLLMNRDSVADVTVSSSSERRVTTSAQIWTAAFLNQEKVPPDFIKIRKDLLDDSNAAKDEMDKVKKKLKGLLRKGNKAPPQFAWPENMPEPYLVARSVVELMKFHRRVMRENFQTLYGGAASSLAAAVKPSTSPTARRSSLSVTTDINKIQSRWCSGEDVELFRERWEKLFNEFCNSEKVDPGRISELHDTIKFDALHNRQFLEYIFAPSPELMEEYFPVEPTKNVAADTDETPFKPPQRSDTSSSKSDKPADKGNFAERIGLKKKPVVDPNTLKASASDPATESYFNLFTGSDRSKTKNDKNLVKLRELFMYSKILFDFIGPQEYGISNSEKLEIGLLTSLPLLRAIVNDLEDMQASPGAKTSVYFTKESHIYTLLNCIIEGGINTKIERNKIPELDYLSTICFELYEAPNVTADDEEASYNYSIRITISPGCHTFEPLDVILDARHCIGFAARRSLTAHNNWKQVIETLRAKFHTVKLPKSFIAVNLSEKVPQAFEGAQEKVGDVELEEEVGGAGLRGVIMEVDEEKVGKGDGTVEV